MHALYLFQSQEKTARANKDIFLFQIEQTSRQTQAHQPYTRFGSIFPALTCIIIKRIVLTLSSSITSREYGFFLFVVHLPSSFDTRHTMPLILRDNIQFGMPRFHSELVHTLASSTTQLKTFLLRSLALLYARKIDKL